MAEIDRSTRDRRGWSPEMITAAAAVVIGVSALFVSLYETHLIRQQQRASVWPHLEAGHGWDGSTFRFLAVNSGIGPARVEQLVIRLDGEPVRDWDELFQRAGLRVSGYVQSQFSGRMLLPGAPLEVLVVNDPEMASAVADRRSDVTVEACYCSIFDECWETDFLEVRRAVRRCGLDTDVWFLQ